MRLAEILAETALAPLYHGTSWAAACDILQDGGFEGLTGQLVNGKPARGLSTSRSPRLSHLNYDPLAKGTTQMINAFNVVFVLDQAAVRRRFRVQPVDYFRGKPAYTSLWDRTDMRRGQRAESEEFIVIPPLPGKRNRLPLAGIVSKIIYYPQSFSDPDDEPTTDAYLAFVQRALRFSIPVVRTGSDFEYGDKTRAWTRADRASMIRHPDQNDVPLSGTGFLDWTHLQPLLTRYEAAGKPLDDSLFTALFDKDEQFRLWQIWLRLNNRPVRMPPATAMTGRTGRVLFDTLARVDPKHPIAHHKITPFRPATPAKLPAKHNGGVKRTVARTNALAATRPPG